VYSAQLKAGVHSLLRALLLLLACGASACSSGSYLGERGRDFAECFTLTASIGPEVSVDAKLTELAHLAIGGGGHFEAGLLQGRIGSAPVVTMGLPFVPFIEDGVLYGRYLFVETGGAWDVDGVQDECYLVHFLPVGATHPTRPWLDRFDLEIGATVLIGARVGFRPGQFLDFIAGCIGFDLAHDDREAVDAESLADETAQEGTTGSTQK